MIVNLVGKGQQYEVAMSILPSAISSKEPLLNRSLDLLLCVGYPNTITKEIISRFSLGVINAHTSLLPKYRGRHPVVWAIMNREKEIGLTIHYIQDETIDTGDIILQDSVLIDINDTYQKVMDKLNALLPRILLIALEQIESGCVYRRKQHNGLASYLPRRTPQDSRIKEPLTIEDEVAFINALSDPMPNAYREFEGKKIYYKEARYEK